MKWMHLYKNAKRRPLATNALADSAANALSRCTNPAAQQVIGERERPDLYFLCLVLDAHSVAVPEDVAGHVKELSL